MIFSWHSGMNALVMPRLDRPEAQAFPSAVLRAAGWKFDPEEMRKALPRADAPGIVGVAGSADVAAAAHQAKMANGVSKMIRVR